MWRRADRPSAWSFQGDGGRHRQQAIIQYWKNLVSRHKSTPSVECEHYHDQKYRSCEDHSIVTLTWLSTGTLKDQVHFSEVRPADTSVGPRLFTAKMTRENRLHENSNRYNRVSSVNAVCVRKYVIIIVPGKTASYVSVSRHDSGFFYVLFILATTHPLYLCFIIIYVLF